MKNKQETIDLADWIITKHLNNNYTVDSLLEEYSKSKNIDSKIFIHGSPYPENFTELDMSINIADRIKSLVLKIDKGEEMFRTDPVFRNSIEVIARGADPIKVLANICEMLQNQNKAFIEHMKACKGVGIISALNSNNKE